MDNARVQGRHPSTQDDWVVMVTDGKDGVQPPNHAARGVSHEWCHTAQHGTVPCCCDEDHLQRVMPGILNEKENTCKWGDRYFKIQRKDYPEEH